MIDRVVAKDSSHRRCSRHRHSSRAAGALAVLLVLLVVQTGPGIAQESSGDSDTPALRVVEQTAWVTPDGTWVLRVVPEGPAVETLSIALHEGVVGRDPFTRGLTGDPLEPVLSRRCAAVMDTGPTIFDDCEIPLDRAHRDEDGAVTVVLGLRASSAGPSDRLLVSNDGVYPVSVAALDRDGAALDQMTTHLVRLPADDDSPPLATAILVPFAAPVALQPDGTTELGPAHSQLDTLGASLDRSPETPVIIVPSPETLVAMSTAGGPESLGDIDTPGPTRQILARPYVDLDVTAWWAAGLDDALTAQLDAGARATAEVVGREPDQRTWVMDNTTTPDTLTRLAAAGIDRLVVSEETLAPLDEGLFPIALDRPFELPTGNGRTLPAVMDDALLRAHAGATGDPVLDGHQLLADLAVLYFQRPATPRGVAVSFDSDQLSDPAFLDTVLDGLDDPTVVAATTLDELFATATPALAEGIDAVGGPVLVRSSSSIPPQDLGDYPERLADAVAQQATINALVGTVDDRRTDELLLVSGDQELTVAEQQQYLDASVKLLAQVTEGIVAPEQAAVTLTARKGQIPVVVRNDLDQPVDVAVRLQSEKLEFPDGDSMVTTLPPGESRLEFTVSTRASGAFPVDIVVTSPDGALELDETRFTLRSTVVPGIGLALSVLAAVFLLIWWARHWRTARRDRRLVEVVKDHPAFRTPAQARQDAIDDITQV